MTSLPTEIRTGVVFGAFVTAPYLTSLGVFDKVNSYYGFLTRLSLFGVEMAVVVMHTL